MEQTKICTKNIKGFTLLELAIAVVVLGFFVTIVVGGKSLMRTARISTVVSEVETFNSAIEVFKLTYEDLPGDMVDAESVWGRERTARSPAGTRNGNGNGLITGGERFRAWEQLGLAGMLPQQFRGTGPIEIDISIPSSDIRSGGYEINQGSLYGLPSVQYFRLASDGTNPINGVVLSALESWQLDKKQDDGVMNTGNIVVQRGRDSADNWSGDCFNRNPFEYDLPKTIPACQVIFRWD